jgi:hypothetical protein
VLHAGLRSGSLRRSGALLCSGDLCAEVLPRAALPPRSDLLPEHLRSEVLLRSGPVLCAEGLCPGHLRTGPVLRSGLRSGDLCAEDLLPEALQARSDLPSEHLRSGVLCADGLCAGVLCADVLRAMLQRAVPSRASLPPASPQLLRKHLRSHLLRSCRPLLWSDHGSTAAGSRKHAAGSRPREEDLSISVLTDSPQEPFGVL